MMHQDRSDMTQEIKRAFTSVIDNMISALENLKRNQRNASRKEIHDLRQDFIQLKNTLNNQSDMITIFEYFFSGLTLLIGSRETTALYPFIHNIYDSFNKPTEITLFLIKLDETNREKIKQIIDNFKNDAEQYFQKYNSISHQNPELLKVQNDAFKLNLMPKQNDQVQKTRDDVTSPSSGVSKFTKNVPDSTRSGKSTFTRHAETGAADDLSVYTQSPQAEHETPDDYSTYTQPKTTRSQKADETKTAKHTGPRLFPPATNLSLSQIAQKFLRNLQYRFMSIALELNDHPYSYIDSLGFKGPRCNNQDKAEQDARKRIKNEAVTPLINFVSFLTTKSKNLKEQQSDNIKIETIMSSVLSEPYDKFQNNNCLCFCLTVFLIECGELTSQQDNYKPKDFDQNLSLLLDRIQNFSENTDPYSMKNFLQGVQNATNPREYFRTECSMITQNLYNIYNLFYKIGIKLKETRSLTNNYNTMIEKLNRELESKTSTQTHDGREDDPLLGKQSSCCPCTIL